MEDIAYTLDILQGEKDITLGHLLPALESLKMDLLKKRDSMKKTRRLIDSLLDGIERGSSGFMMTTFAFLLQLCTLSEFNTSFSVDLTIFKILMYVIIMVFIIQKSILTQNIHKH